MNQGRIARVIEGMRKEGLSQLLVSSLQSVYYLTGLWVPQGERLLVLKLDVDGSMTLFVNRMFALSGQQGTAQLVEFDDVDDSVRVLCDHLKPGKLGVDKTWPSHFLIRLMQLRPDVMPVLGSAPVDEARMLKDADEIVAMRASSHMNDEVTRYLRTSITAGESEMAVARRYLDRAIELGAAGTSFSALICFGANAAEPHHGTDLSVLKEGDAVIMDVGLDLGHAMSDMTRTVFFGSATDEQKRVYDTVLRANMAAKKVVRPGIPMKDVDRAARAVIEDAGYGPQFLHRTGHGIGIEVHEPPDASAISEAIARPGMIFSIEPGIYLPGKFGVRIEDLVLVTEDGVEVLNELDRDLMIIR
ncbi:Xaa-Pro peptidase family protein [Eubacteriales bacterium OttesenSCG-928-N13]|nr:Xaa-Pro peptidase family protein [Eubacteriales bacterium OttesenSCG-928-N13]